ncbi:MAG: indolepyruvate ferredoxin oxidoreductase subunit alpha [Planctomycetes bacterium]|nr:indolepyruvate ferredoxin oxidoreductase subunit alpha [Planctomycetota bacterium]
MNDRIKLQSLTATTQHKILMGNSAIARGLIESGCEVMTAYPGTPSTEIFEEVVRYKKELGLNIYTEWSINEKIAFDIAYAAAIAGKRSAVSMKQVGLNVASDSLMSAVYTGTVGGFVVISCDDPGPHSSQTEQDTRLFSIFAKIPVLDPSTPQEALELTKYAYEISERYNIPVIVRPVTRLCHGSAPVSISELAITNREAKFKKDPARWAATPSFRLKLHKELEDKLIKIREEFNSNCNFNFIINENIKLPLGIICSGVAYATVSDILNEADTPLPILKIATVHPLPLKLVEDFTCKFSKVLVVEEPDRAIEIQIRDRRNVLGRETGHIPSAGELLPEVVYESLRRAAEETKCEKLLPQQQLPELSIDFVRPTLCPGCGHRASFFSIRKAKANGIFPSDIGCYTLGINMKSVDTVLDMGAGITIADGLAKAYAKDNSNIPPIIATIGDSTFFHAGIPGLLNAHVTGSAFVLVILDNSIVAMTGFQPTAESGRQADGREVPKVSIESVVRACGIEFVEEIDPYKINDFVELVKKAHNHVKLNSKIAVIVARRPCALLEPSTERLRVKVIGEKCNGCEYCLKYCECPALKFNSSGDKVFVEDSLCTECGVCIDCCPLEAIVEA